MVKIYGLHDTPIDLNKGNRPSSLHTNRLSTSVHSGKNLVHSTGVLNWKQIYSSFWKDIFYESNKMLHSCKTSSIETFAASTFTRLFICEFLCLVISTDRHQFFACCVYLFVVCNFARFHGIWLRTKVAGARTRVVNEYSVVEWLGRSVCMRLLRVQIPF